MDRWLEEFIERCGLCANLYDCEPVSDSERFWKWMMIPLMDVPDEELVWCWKQDGFNSFCSKKGWESEIRRRGGMGIF